MAKGRPELCWRWCWAVFSGGSNTSSQWQWQSDLPISPPSSHPTCPHTILFVPATLHCVQFPQSAVFHIPRLLYLYHGPKRLPHRSLLCLVKSYLSFIWNNGENIRTCGLGESKEAIHVLRNSIWPVVSTHYILAIIVTLLSRFNSGITTHREPSMNSFLTIRCPSYMFSLHIEHVSMPTITINKD